MPLLTVHTNLAVDDKTAVCTSLSSHTAKILGKPESYVMVMLQDKQAITFAGNEQPTALVQLKSLGLPEADTPGLSQSICHQIGELLDIPANRVYIEFASPARHMWGWDNKTF